MKTNSTPSALKAIIALVIFSCIYVSVSAQCSAPALKFVSPSLVSGTAGKANATYKFANVTTGIDAYVTIVSLTGGAKLVNIDDTTTGYSDAWQPVVGGPGTGVGTSSYITWRINFVIAAYSTPYTFPCFTLSAIDVDGDGTKVREFIQALGISSFNVHSPTSLTVTNAGDSAKGLAALATKAGIDTSAWNTNINFNYSNITGVTIETGSYIDNSKSGGSPDRYNCIFFQQIGAAQMITSPIILPVTYVSFNAIPTNKGVMLNWITSNEINNNHFEVEESTNNNEFTTVAYVLDGFAKAGGTKEYQYNDNSSKTQSSAVVYYRLKQVDANGHVSYSKVIAVKLQSDNNTTVMQVSPNPFAEQLYVRFSANASGNATIKVVSMTGQTVAFKQSIIGKGYNNVQVFGLGGLPKGMYVAQLMVNGVVVGTEKVVRN